MTPRQSFVLILNARSGGSSAGDAGAELLRERGCELSIVRSRSPEETLQTIRGAGDVAGIVIGGGDGTISLALPALIERGLPLGILPLGTANDFARSIGVADMKAACDAIAQGALRSVDLGAANGRPFLNVVALGLPAQAARELTAERKRRFGMFAALAAAPSIARRRHVFTLNATIDGDALQARCEAVLLGVGRYVGGFPIAYEDLDDGKLHLMVCRALSASEVLSLALSALFRRLPQDDRILERTAVSVLLETTVPMDVAIDGDICAKTPIEVRILASKLRVFVPATAS